MPEKTTDELLAELDSLGLRESEEFLNAHPGLREAAYERDMQRRQELNEGTPGDPNFVKNE